VVGSPKGGGGGGALPSPPGPGSVWPLCYSNFITFFQPQFILAEWRRRRGGRSNGKRRGRGISPPGLGSLLPLFHSNYLILSAAVYIGGAEEEAWWAVPREEEGAGHFPTRAWIIVASLPL
jgi:hypothetical protein